MLKVFEVKEKSPFGFVSPLSKIQMLNYCDEHADIISIHTNELWGGSFEWLKHARKLTNKPILAKGFHDTIFDVQKAFDCGADYVLTVGWYPNDPRCWHECESLMELAGSKAEMVVWNSRNPRTGEEREGTIKLARRFRQGKLCQASGIKNESDINQDVDATLIGESLWTNYNSQKTWTP